MKATIELLKKHDELRVINQVVDINLEIAHIAYVEVKKSGGKALLFTNVINGKNGKKFSEPVLMNLFGSYNRTKLLFNKDIEKIAQEITDLMHIKSMNKLRDKFSLMLKLFSLKRIFPKKSKEKYPPCQEIIYKDSDINLYDLPILKTWSEDGGAFITMGQVYTQSLNEEMVNLGMYRLQVYDNNHLGMHWQIHKDASHFFDQYQRAGKQMPVSIAIGGDPLYSWCATAPLPYGMNELLLYGFIKGDSAKIVRSVTTPLYIPRDVDYVIEGWVDPTKLEIEGPFGDHTGYYTLKDEYPIMQVSAITRKKEPIYLATVVGKPPLEDKYMGWATERIFLPLLKMTAPDLVDYHMPENGAFHNLILVKMKPLYKGHAKQFMHAFWGQGQMSFVKHAIFVNEDAPKLTSYESISSYILNKINPKKFLITSGICDALDHASPEVLEGGKLGIDCTTNLNLQEAPKILENKILLEKLQQIDSEIVDLVQYKIECINPIVVISVNKKRSMHELFKKINELKPYIKILVAVDAACNDIHNPYMLIWRVTNNLDAIRDIFIKDIICIDGTNKNVLDGYTREWPGDVNCDKKVLKSLKQRSLLDYDDNFEKNFYL